MGVKRYRGIGYRFLVLVFLALFVVTGCGSMGGSSNNSAADSSGGMANQASSADMASMAFTVSDQRGESKDLNNRAGAEDGGRDDEAPRDMDVEAPGFGSDETNQAINRKLIYRANVTMEVEEFAAAQTEIRNLIQLSGGYLLEFSESKTEYEKGGAFVIKVPSSGFMTFLSHMEQLSPDHYESRITGQDVTEEYVDLESRLHAQQVTEERLLAFMEQATRADDLVEFSRELGRVQQEIEQIKGRMRYLEQNVAYSTIEARIYEKMEGVSRLSREDTPFGERLSQSLTAVLEGISIVLQELIIFIVAAIPVAIVLGIIAAPFYMWYRSSRKKEQERLAGVAGKAGVAGNSGVTGKTEETPGLSHPNDHEPLVGSGDQVHVGGGQTETERTSEERPNNTDGDGIERESGKTEGADRDSVTGETDVDRDEERQDRDKKE